MEQSNFSKIVKILTLAYPYYFKEMGTEDAIMFNKLYYSKLRDYKYEIVKKAINNIIDINKFMPTLAEVLEECKIQNKIYYKNIIDKMYKDNYFKSDEEYGRAAILILTEGIIPEWLKNDMISYEENEIKLISGQ